MRAPILPAGCLVPLVLGLLASAGCGSKKSDPSGERPEPPAARRGVLVTYVDGQEVGRERFHDDGAVLTSEVELGPAKVTVKIARDGKVVVDSGAGETERRLEEGMIALENGSWQSYALAAEKHADANEPRAVKVLVPSLDRVVDGTIQVRAAPGGDREVEVVAAGLTVKVQVSKEGLVTRGEAPAQATIGLPEGERPAPPAERAPPAGVTAEPVELEVPGAVLRGDLWLPSREDDRPAPVLLLVAGSGPTDRDGNGPLGLSTDTYRLIAEGLAGRGVASLRFDKRGIGASTSETREEELTMQTFADDVVALTALLRADPRFSAVVLAGHSEGGLVAMMAAQTAKVDGLALVATPGRKIGEVLREQLGPKLDPKLGKEAERIIAALETGGEVGEVPDLLAPIFRPSIQRFIASQMALDPPALLRSLEGVPVVVLHAAHDAQVAEADAKALAGARPDAELVVLPRASHVLKDEASAALPQRSYTDPSLPLSDGVIDAVMRVVPAARE
jgi:uncharacterized protein